MAESRLLAETTLGTEPARHVGAVTEWAKLRTSAAAERDGATAGLNPVAVMIDDLERPANDQGPVLVRCDHGAPGFAHAAAMPSNRVRETPCR